MVVGARFSVFMKNDFYQVLGVSQGASALEIKEAYRRLVRLHHPDANPENRAASEALMKQVLQAYATLGDSGRRSRYDSDQKLRAFEQSQQETEHRVFHYPARAGTESPTSLMGRVRVTLGESGEEFAAHLGLSEADLRAYEARDAMPQAALQMRTFGNFVERAAQKLETAQKISDAQDLRSAFGRKKANRNFMK